MLNRYWNILRPDMAQTIADLFNLLNGNFRILGLDISQRNGALKYMIAIVAFAPSALFYAFHAFEIFKEDGKIEEYGQSIMLLFAAPVQIIPKIITYMTYSSEINAMVALVVQTTTKSYANKNEEERLLEEYTKLFRFVTKVTYGALLFVCFSVYILPYFINFAIPIWFLPLSLNIPGLSKTTHPGYDIHYLLMDLFAIYSLLFMSMNLIFLYFGLFIAFRFDFCQHLLSHVGDFNSVYNTDEQQTKLLQEIVILHAAIFRFGKRCSRIFELISLFEIISISASLALCLTFFKYRPYVYALGLASVCGSGLVFCLFGEIVNTKRLQTLAAIYDSYWYQLNVMSDRKVVLFLLKGHQIDMSFAAYGLFQLSLELYLNIMKASFTYFTFLQSIV